MGWICPNCVLVYLLISRLGGEHSSWAIFFCNALCKEANPPPFDVVTLQLLDKSCLINKFGASDSGMALIDITSKKCKFNPISSVFIQGKSTYNKANAKCTYCKKSFYEAVDYWIFYSELARSGWISLIANKLVQATPQNNPNIINFMNVYANSVMNP